MWQTFFKALLGDLLSKLVDYRKEKRNVKQKRWNKKYLFKYTNLSTQMKSQDASMQCGDDPVLQFRFSERVFHNLLSILPLVTKSFF